MGNKPGAQKAPTSLLFTIFGRGRSLWSSYSPTHDWAATSQEFPLRVECVLNPYGHGRVKVDIVKLLDPVPDWLNDKDLVTIAQVVKGLVAEATGGEVTRITADDILPFALVG